MTAERGASAGYLKHHSTAYEIREIPAKSLSDLSKVAAMYRELLGFGPIAGLGCEFVRKICYAVLLREPVLDTAIAEVDGGNRPALMLFQAACVRASRPTSSRPSLRRRSVSISRRVRSHDPG